MLVGCFLARDEAERETLDRTFESATLGIARYPIFGYILSAKLTFDPTATARCYLDYLYSSCRRISRRTAVRREQNKVDVLGWFTVCRHGRFWAVKDASGELVCLTVYKCGAEEVTRRLESQEVSTRSRDPHKPPTPDKF